MVSVDHRIDSKISGRYRDERKIKASETIDTLAHEMRHAWQNSSTSDKAERFKSDLEHPKDPTINYEAYREQVSEQDAREYATQFCNQIQNKSPELEKLNYESSKIQPIYPTKENELGKNLDYKTNDLIKYLDPLSKIADVKDKKTFQVVKEVFASVDTDCFRDDKVRLHLLRLNKNLENFKARDVNNLINFKHINGVDIKQLKQNLGIKDEDSLRKLSNNINSFLTKEIKKAVGIREDIYDNHIKSNQDYTLCRKDINILADNNAYSMINKGKLFEQIMKDKREDENENIINLEDCIDWGEGTLGLDVNKCISPMTVSKCSGYLVRQGSPMGNNVTSPVDSKGTMPKLSSLSVPYPENPDAVHKYKIVWNKYMEIMDNIDNISSKINVKDEQIKGQIEDQVKELELNRQFDELRNELNDTSINDDIFINAIVQYKKFQNNVKWYLNNDKVKYIESMNLRDYRYGIMGSVALLGNYEGGAPQYNTPVSLGILERLHICKNLDKDNKRSQ